MEWLPAPDRLTTLTLLRAKLTALVPVAVAVTLYAPTVPFAVNADEVAVPLEFVLATHA